MDLIIPTKTGANPKQIEFLTDKIHKYIAYGGARGGGKSWVVRIKSILLSYRYPGIKCCIVRKSYPELISNHINPMLEILHGFARYNRQNKVFTFPNKSTIIFKYCANDKDLETFQGLEFDCLFIDEATQYTEEQFQKMKVCVRGVNDFPKRVYLTCNPGGCGHGWVKRLFIEKKYKPGENPDDYRFIQAKVTDNTALMESMPEYIENLKALPDKLRTAWLEGNWDLFEGQFFEDFVDNPEHYHDGCFTNVIEPFEIPKEWKIYRSYDFGYAKPFSCAWWAVDFDGCIYRILELYGCTHNANEGVKWTPDKQFEEIAKLEKEHRWLKGKDIRGVADPAIWNASMGESVAETAMRHGIYFDKGDNSRINGWMQVHYRLAFDENGRSMMYVFNTCKGFIRTIPLLVYSSTKPEDLDTEGEDHIADETRYFCMSRPIKPRRTAEVREVADDPLRLNEDKRYRRYW